MNKPYTCHNCGTQFDAQPDQDDLGEAACCPPATKVKVKCPGCYDAGFAEIEQMIYTLDISGAAVLAR